MSAESQITLAVVEGWTLIISNEDVGELERGFEESVQWVDVRFFTIFMCFLAAAI